MGDLSPITADQVYNHLTGREPWPMPAAVYLALYDHGDELEVAGYGRLQASMSPPEEGRGTNDITLGFGPLSGQGTVTHGALYDAPEGGRRLTKLGRLHTPRSWQDGDTIEIRPGDLTLGVG